MIEAAKRVEGLSKDETVVKYASLVKYLAQRTMVRLPASVELDDLISTGVIGLMDAFDKYDATRENKFKTYAEFRIRGAILDELRRQDWIPRSVREKAKELERAIARIEGDTGRAATTPELCRELKLTQEDLAALKALIHPPGLVSSETFSIHDLRARDPEALIDYQRVLDRLSTGARGGMGRACVVLYYEWGLLMSEIGHCFGITESRVCQLLHEVIGKTGLRLNKEIRNGSAIDPAELYARLTPAGAERLDRRYDTDRAQGPQANPSGDGDRSRLPPADDQRVGIGNVRAKERLPEAT